MIKIIFIGALLLIAYVVYKEVAKHKRLTKAQDKLKQSHIDAKAIEVENKTKKQEKTNKKNEH